MKKILCPGEALIDLFGVESKSLTECTTFEKKAGGAPANAAYMMKQYGVESYFTGTVGNDPFGQFLKGYLNNAGINTKYMQMTNELFTTFAYVSIDETGERDFIFNRGADIKLDLSTINLTEFDGFHFASATAFLGGELNSAYDHILDYAVDNKKFISFDANYRDALITDERDFIAKCNKYIQVADIVKLSEEELYLIAGNDDLEQAGKQVAQTMKGYLIITLGSKGSVVFYQNQVITIPSIKLDKVIDTTGAGDAFIGSLVANAINEKELSLDVMKRLVEISNTIGAETTQFVGAIKD